MCKTPFVAALFLVLAVTGPSSTYAQADQQTPSSIASDFAWPLGALASRFTVTEGNDAQHDLGSWAKVDGLKVTFDVVEYRAGGGTITLHRRAGAQSLLVKDWLQRLSESLQPTTVTIVLYGFDGTPLARWVLSGVFPTKWSIESDSADADVPIETLVLQYERIHLVSR